MAQDRGDIEQLMADYVAWENGDSAKLEVISESVDVYNPGLPGGEVHNRDDWQAYFEKIQAAFPDYEVQAVAEITGSDMAMHEVKITGTHQSEFKGVPATGREVEVHAMGKYLIEDGQIVEIHHFYDTAELQTQLGLTFPEVIGQLPQLIIGKLQSVF